MPQRGVRDERTFWRYATHCRAGRSCRSIFSRLVRIIVVAFLSMGIFVAGFVVGNDRDLSVAAKAVVYAAADSAGSYVSSILGETRTAATEAGPKASVTTANSIAPRATATAVPPSDTPAPNSDCRPAVGYTGRQQQLAVAAIGYTGANSNSAVPPSDSTPTATAVPTKTPVPTATALQTSTPDNSDG